MPTSPPDNPKPAPNTTAPPGNGTNADGLSRLEKLVEAGFRSMNANFELQAEAYETLNVRMGSIEKWRAKQDERLDRASLRVRKNDDAVRENSSADLEHQALLAKELIARQELALKVDTVMAKVENVITINQKQSVVIDKLGKIADSPLLKTLLVILTIAVMTYAANHGVHLETVIH
jgi:hypothetical protein